MTAGNNGADTPENDDPFAYLYRSEGGEGGAPGPSGDGPAARQPGVPRTSYNQVRAVGQRQYGQQAPQQVTYGQQNAHYAAPETLPGGDRTRSAPAPGNGGQEPRRGRNGLLIGAVAVVAVVCIGIGVAMLTNGKNAKDDTAGKPGPTMRRQGVPRRQAQEARSRQAAQGGRGQPAAGRRGGHGQGRAGRALARRDVCGGHEHPRRGGHVDG